MRSTRKSHCVVLTGGKTGGHIYPALAIADIVESRFQGCPVYIGAADGMESKILAGETIPFYGIEVAPLVGMSPKRKLTGLLRNLKGFFQSISLLKKLKPSLVIGTGGFVAGPVLAAAFLLRIPMIIHEQNVMPGLTNRILSRVAREIWMTFSESAGYFPSTAVKVLTGMPLRKNFQGVSKEDGRKHFAFEAADKVLLVTGGSQGSRIINETITALYGDIIGKLGYRILHITGPSFYQGIIDNLKPGEQDALNRGSLMIKDYLREMDLALAAADVVISRSGASFIAELIATNSYSIQIPMKKSAGNHQLKNAKAVEKAGLGTILEEDQLNPQSLYHKLESLQIPLAGNIMRNNAGILYGENTREIIGKAMEKYLI